MLPVIIRAIDELRADIKHVRNDVDVMKGILLEDRFLSSDERKHLDETMRLLKEGKKSEFVKMT